MCSFLCLMHFFFMSDAFLAIATADTIPSESAARGVARILSVCADALHESAEGES